MIKSISTSLFCMIFSFSLVSCNAQTEKSGNNKWEAGFAKKYSEAQDVKWNKDANGNNEAQFEMNGKKYQADFDDDGNWIETERSIKWGELPKPIQQQVEKDFDKDDLSEIEWVDHPEKGEFYDVEFKSKGQNKDVEFKADGTRIN